MENAQIKRAGTLKQFMTNEKTSFALDVLPVVGSGKMITEAIAGQDITGKELDGKDRIIHGAIGVASGILNLTGIGAAAKTGGVVVGKSVLLLEKAAAKATAKGAVRLGKVLTKTSKFAARHPKITKRVEQYTDKKIRKYIRHSKEYRQGQRAA